MTSNLKLPRSLTTTPKTVANYVFNAYKTKKNIIYVTTVWKYIMKVIKLIPERVFKKLKI